MQEALLCSEARALGSGMRSVYQITLTTCQNTIICCNMENFDPLGTHTGDSIVVAPSQTLTDDEYHMLRSAAIKIVRHVGVVGECNVSSAVCWMRTWVNDSDRSNMHLTLIRVIIGL
jgi:carbamoylphosphate synthase large subunit